jgi:SAM-dependent methyltransferase
MAGIWQGGDAYEAYVGRWSRLVAGEFLGWLDLPAGSAWLDVGCGTGELTRMILDRRNPSAVTGVDPSAAFLAHATAHTPDTRATFHEAGAESLPFADGAFDVAVSGLVLNFVPDPAAGVAEMARVTRKSGTVAAYVWDYAGKMELIRYFFDAAIELDPAAVEHDEGPRFSFCNEGGLVSLFNAAGLQSTEARAIDVPTHFRDFDDYWSPFLAGTGVAPAYAMSLSEPDREALRERIRESLPIQSDGSIHLVARAWAVRGIA